MRLVAEALRRGSARADGAASPPRLSRETSSRVRVYAPDGRRLIDSRALGVRNFVLRDPDKQGWQIRSRRAFSIAVIDTVVGAERAPLYRDRDPDVGSAWPDVRSRAPTNATRARCCARPIARR